MASAWVISPPLMMLKVCAGGFRHPLDGLGFSMYGYTESLCGAAFGLTVE